MKKILYFAFIFCFVSLPIFTSCNDDDDSISNVSESPSPADIQEQLLLGDWSDENGSDELSMCFMDNGKCVIFQNNNDAEGTLCDYKYSRDSIVFEGGPFAKIDIHRLNDDEFYFYLNDELHKLRKAAISYIDFSRDFYRKQICGKWEKDTVLSADTIQYTMVFDANGRCQCITDSATYDMTYYLSGTDLYINDISAQSPVRGFCLASFEEDKNGLRITSFLGTDDRFVRKQD